MKRLISFVAVLLWLTSPLFAQGTMLLREPTVSDTQIVFGHANDLWIVERDGGDARRLTTAIGAEINPRFSPDGSMVAFTGEYDGNTDVYVIPAEGGEPVRLTWHPGADIVQDWTPDGEHVIFMSGRSGYPTANTTFFKVPVSGGTPVQLEIPFGFAGAISPDGSTMAYQPYRFWDPEWRNYRGGQAQPIWVFNMETHDFFQTPRTDGERHTAPVWMGETIYYLSERDMANNIWSYNTQTKEERQITFHTQFDVKNISAASDIIVYEQGGYLHSLDPETGESTQLEIYVRGDLNWARSRFTNVPSSQLSNARLSPTGQRAVFEYRGEILTIPKEHGDWRNLTQTSYAAERAPVWSPDGSQIAWFSDASGEYQLHVSDQFGMEDPRVYELNNKFYYLPDWSPDGSHIAFTDTDYNLWYINLESGDLTLVDTDRFAHPNRTMNPVWSPDGEWITYVRLLDNQFKSLFVHQVSTGENHMLTDGLADVIDPQWDESGKYLYFLASTDFGLNTGWLDMSSYNMPVTRGLYMIVLSADEPSPFLPLSDDEAGSEDSSDSDNNDNTVRIDLENIDQRIIAIDVPVRNYSGTVTGPEGHVFFTEVRENMPDVLHRYSLEDRKSIEFLSGVNYAITSHDRKQLLYRSGSTWGIVPAAGQPVSSGDGRISTDGIRIQVNPREEYHQILKEGWRFQRDFLYVDNVHGAPWDEIYEWYSPWVEHVRHRSDLNYIIGIMGGEVAVGHSYFFGGDFPDVESVPGGLLGADYEISDGYFRISRIYTGENWNPGLTSPLSGPGISVNEGDYLLEVNGRALTADMNLYELFEATSGRQTKIRVNNRPGFDGSRVETVVPINNENGLRMRHWIESNRRMVDHLSDGQLAYVYVPNTGAVGYEYFNRYYFSQQDKAGAVIDERNNGGGSAADYMVDIMSRQLHGYFNSRANDRKPFTTPMAGIWGPKVMIINENAGSGGDLLPYMFRKMEIGPLIGTRTWGGLVGTWDTPRFIDGGGMIAPRGGFFNTDGEWAVEGEGVAPDIEVFQHPAEVMRGLDPQLEASVREALRLLRDNPVELHQEPEPPVRWARPDRP
ncbi:MAG: PDZ domain-containing protein [Balneolia bacterium]|nr:PDZ domain-containing protein [Balneolia bacterium]